MAVELRRWQREAADAVREHWGAHGGGFPAPLVVACTGAGKTLFCLGLVVPRVLEGQRVVWLAHREELLLGPYNDVAEHWPDLVLEGKAGIVQGDRDEHDRAVVFASEPTLRTAARRVPLRGADVVVVDEGHHSQSDSYREILADLVDENTLVVALTATADRADGRDLSEHWQIVYSYGIVEALADRVLLPPYAAVDPVPGVDLEALEALNEVDAVEELLRADVVAHTVAAMNKQHEAVALPFRDSVRNVGCRGRSGLVFTATVQQATETVARLEGHGWSARVVHGNMPRTERRKALDAFRAGAVKVLCNAGVLTEGTNLPVASFAVIARAARSWSLFVQMVGRCLRKGSGRSEAFLLDLVGATRSHSLVGAPILVGADGCAVSLDGRHRYQDDGVGGGVCPCGHRVACIKAKGPHVFPKKGKACERCGLDRCLESPDGWHMWRVISPTMRECCWCGAPSSSPMAGLLGAGGAPPEPVAWRRLRPGLVGVLLEGGVGGLFVQTVNRTTFTGVVVTLDGTVHPLSPSPVPRAHIGALCADVVRRARLVGERRGGVCAPWQGRRADGRLQQLATLGGL